MVKSLPPVAAMYRALLEKDRAYEGVFFVGVKTTGIFCRPTCPARKPKPENVEFFSSREEAMYRGYRPCLRCRPLEENVPSSPLVRKLLERFESHPDERIRDADLRQMGIDPAAARRHFKRYCGMTFQAYQRARRMGRALVQLREGDSVIGAQLDSGYGSASGFWEAFRKVFGQAGSRSDELAVLFARWIDTPLGAMVALADDRGLHLLEFVDRRGLEREILVLRRRTGAVVLPGAHAYLDEIEENLAVYFSGKDREFSVPVVLHGSPFERSVWEALQEIPPGATRSYGKLAATIGRPQAVRAVGRANGKNCLAIIVPCHRLIGADGKLTGYGGGLWRKQWLLEHERRQND